MDGIRTHRDVALRMIVETVASLALATPATFAITFGYFGGDLSQSITGWQALHFGLGLTVAECLLVCPIVAYRGLDMLRTLNNLRDRLHALANRDPLTGLLNRRGFDEGAQALERSPIF